MTASTELSKPRILCLHGGGVTAEIFQLQARSLVRSLPDFRLVFADGPWFCNAGPGIVPVFEGYGPYRRWLRWLPEQPELDDESAREEIFYALDTAKKRDEGNGKWVGLIGFSQGAKLAASLLYDQQIKVEKEGKAETDYKFAVLLAGRSPIVSFCEHSKSEATITAGALSEGFSYDGESPHILKLPTLHVHGLEDPGLHLHKRLLTQYCDPETSEVFEWEGGHRVPIKTADVRPICDWIYKMAKENGVRLDA